MQKKRWFKFPIHPSQYQWYEPQSQLAFPGVGSDHHYAWFDNYFVDRLGIAAEWLDTHALSQKPEDHFCAVSRDDRTMAILWGLYLGDVQEGDRKLGHLQEMLDGARATRPLVIIVTSDHGEHLGEHRLFQHHFSVREPLLHVPLVIHGLPDVAPAVIDTPVELADLMPTMLEWAVVPMPQNLAGRPLPTHSSAAVGPRPLIAELDYDLLADPKEERNLAATHPDLVATLTAELRRQTGAPPDAKAASGGCGGLERDRSSGCARSATSPSTSRRPGGRTRCDGSGCHREHDAA